MKNSKSSVRSIRNRLILFFMVFVVTISLSHFLARTAFEDLEVYQVVIHQASQNNEIVEQIINYADEMVDGEKNIQTLLNSDIRRFDLNIELLEEGGSVVFDGQQMKIPPTSKETQALIKDIYEIWSSRFKIDAMVFVNQEIFKDSLYKQGQRELTQRARTALQNLRQNRETLLSLNDRLIEKYLSISKKQKDQANLSLWTVLIINFVLISIGVYLIQILIIRPLQEISYVAESIGKGDFNQKVDYSQNNEVGSVAQAINGMVDKIKMATSFIKNIEEGNLSISYTEQNGQNGQSLEKDSLVGALINMRDRMKTVAEEEDARNWATEGLAKFGQILQTASDDTETLSYEIVSNVVEYVNANQGGIFIANDEEQDEEETLELVASYAFQRRRYIDKQVIIGEGLVGQAYKDSDTIYITDIPDNYVDITSGLGGAKPRSVLVIPLKLSDRVYGVMELASFNEFKAYEIAFLEKLSENIATNLNASRTNERTRRLLNESHRITEQMRKTEQELTFNLQMLSDTQQEMQKNQEALAAQSFAIKSTLITVELGMDQNILSANDLFLKAIKYREEELIGKSHRSLIPSGRVEETQFAKLWQDLNEGKPHYGEFKHIAKDGSEIWLKATYSPLKDKNGRPYKILKLAFDVTEEKRLRLDFKEQLDSFKRSSAVVEFSPGGKIIDANDNFLDLMGYKRDEIIGRDHTLIVPDDERQAKSYLALWHKLKQGRYHIGEVKRVTKQGQIVWFQGSFNPILDLNGRPYKIIEFIIDVTARKNAETRILATKEELQQKEANLSALINNTDDTIYTIGSNYRVILFNETAAKFYEALGESLRLGSNMLDLTPKNYYYIWKGYYDRALAGEKFSVEQAIFSDKTNQKFYLSISFNPILDEKQEVTGVSVFSRNITQRKQREIDIADFTRKQANRTARIIESQKHTLQEAITQAENIRTQLQEEIQSQQVYLDSISQELALHHHAPTVLLAINHEYCITYLNQQAKETYRAWNFYLQPEYDLLDTFPIQKFELWKSYCDRVLKGESFTVYQPLKNKYQQVAKVFAVHFKPITTEIQEVKQALIAAYDITDYAQYRNEKQRKKVINQRKRYQWRLKATDKELKELEIELASKMNTAEYQLQEKDEVIRLLDTCHDAVVLRIDHEYLCTRYSFKTKTFLKEWDFYLQPDYHLPDVFPMSKFDEWVGYLEQGFKGKSIKFEDILINRIQKKISLHQISLLPEKNDEGKVVTLLIQIKDVSHKLKSRRKQHKQKK